MSRSYANASKGVQKKTFGEFADMVATKPNRLSINVERLRKWYDWYSKSSLTNNKKHAMITRALKEQAHMKLLPSMMSQTDAEFVTKITNYYRPDNADIRKIKGMLIGKSPGTRSRIENVMRSSATDKDDKIFLLLKSRNTRERLLNGSSTGLTNDQLNQKLLEQGRPLKKYKRNRIHTQVFIHGGNGGNGGNSRMNGKVGKPIGVSISGTGMHNTVPKYVNNNSKRSEHNVVRKINIRGGMGGKGGSAGMGGEGGESANIRLK
jgi:rRNA processing protein Krr1/Pno1